VKTHLAVLLTAVMAFAIELHRGPKSVENLGLQLWVQDWVQVKA
jgi:hypothetical protein